ncbi:MAG: DUF1573 domain-containing protein [Planctomycetota bacterium]
MIQSITKKRSIFTSLFAGLLLFGSGSLGLKSLVGEEVFAKPESPVTVEGPVIALVATDVSYGDLLQGETIERDILIRNDGDVVLNLWRANPSCGCTIVIDKPAVVPPGETVAVRIAVDSKKIKAGSTRKGVTFESDDPQQPQLRFIFTMNVINLFHTDPKPIKLFGLMSDSKSLRIKLLAATDLGFEVLGARSRNGEFEITDFVEVEKDRAYEVEVTAAASAEPRNIKDPLDLLIQVKDGRQVVVGRYVEIEHLDPIQLNPPRVLQFGNKDTDPLLGDGVPVVTKKIQIQNVDPEFTLKVERVQLEGFPEGLFEVAVEEVVAGRIFRISVSLEEYRKEVLLRGKLIIVTNDPRQPNRILTMAAKFGRL